MTKRLSIFVLFAFIINASFSAWADPTIGNHYPLEIKRVKDGDTIKGNVLLGFGVALMDKDIRLVGFDAWEINKRRRTITYHPEELERGKKAHEALINLLKTGKPFLYPSKVKDPYGRLTGYLIIYPSPKDGKVQPPIRVDIWMKKNGHHRGDK